MKATREQIIESLRSCAKNESCAKRCVYEKESFDCETGKACLDMLMDQAADMLEQDAPRWISVKDRLPENDDEVAIASGSYMTTGYYDGEWHGMLSYVTHWMPLPEPPKEEIK